MTGTQLSDLPYELIFKILRFTTSYDTLLAISTIPVMAKFVKDSTVVIRLSIEDESEQDNITNFTPVLSTTNLSNHVYELKVPRYIFRDENVDLFPFLLRQTDFLQSASQQISFLCVEVYVTNEHNKWDQAFHHNIIERLNISSILRFFGYKIRVLNIDYFGNKSTFVPYGYQRLQSFRSKEETLLYPGYYKLHPFPYKLDSFGERGIRCSLGVEYSPISKSLSFISASCLNKNTTNLRRANFAVPKVPASSGFKYEFSSGEDWIEPSINLILYNRSTEVPLSPRESARGLARVSSNEATEETERSRKCEIVELVDHFNASYYQDFKTLVLDKIQSQLQIQPSLSQSCLETLFTDILIPKPYSSDISKEQYGTTNDPRIAKLSASYFNLFDILYSKSQKDWRNQEVEFIKIKLYLDGPDTKNVMDQVLQKGEQIAKESHASLF
ncbi:hypothetical protein WICPIJ_001838 [Wickerhamomyces pijperi]|uniref:F-box domain-containing protein n=1 Tax=Wickerhamomyces pijperi TaxID=599730 RepID=A0A9P8QCX2_WICPI|nr:hypothetical protein WICPIJ_001838 [Wickerhamomyces pijperi]